MKGPRVLGIIMAGGRGARLDPLTRSQVKPAVHFGGKYRIIDFVLSNFFNSGIFSLYVLVQYCAHTLIEHLRTAWVERGMIREHFLTVIPPELSEYADRYRGTADAIFQNLNIIKSFDPDVVAIFSADHVFRMDISQMVDFHRANQADVTVTAMVVSRSEARRFGVLTTDSTGRIIRMVEKPSDPPGMDGAPEMALVSMGHFLFRPAYLYEIMNRYGEKISEFADFSAHLLPQEIGTSRMFAYNFRLNHVPGSDAKESSAYWRDVGTLAAYFQAHMDLLSEPPRLSLSNPRWPIRGSRRNVPPTHLYRVNTQNALIAEGCNIQNASLYNAVVGRDVIIEPGAQIRDSVIMDGARIGQGARLLRTVVDSNTVISADSRIAPGAVETLVEYHDDPEADIVVVPRPLDDRHRPMPMVLSTEEYF